MEYKHANAAKLSVMNKSSRPTRRKSEDYDYDDISELTEQSEQSEQSEQPEQPSIDSTKINNIDSKSFDKAVSDHITKLYKQEIKRYGIAETIRRYKPSNADSFFLNIYQEIEDKEIFSGKISKKDTVGFFITISPPLRDGHPIMNDHLLLEKARKHYMKNTDPFTERHFVIEQSGETEDQIGRHPHLHILLRLNKSNQSGEPLRAYKTIERHWKDFISLGKFCVDIKHVSEVTYAKKLEYMQGKKDEDKLEKVKMDKIWRERNGYLPVYSYLPPKIK